MEMPLVLLSVQFSSIYLIHLTCLKIGLLFCRFIHICGIKCGLYQFEENGETKYWSGRGRAPKLIDGALKNGHSLDEFLIKKDASSSSG